MSVTWVVSDGRHEVSSRDHLLQLMHGGALFTDTGSPPADYMSSAFSQTVDIDLESDPRIAPIGSPSASFTGSYDGNNFSITDWTYSPPAPADHAGLFGHVSGSTLENISLEGSWFITSGGSRCGFLVGEAVSSTGIFNVTLDASSGAVEASGDEVGGLVGSASGSTTMEGLTVQGVLASISGADHVAGVVGSVTGSTLNFCRNAARFSGSPAISGGSCSGVCSRAVDSGCSYAASAMTGDVAGVHHAGGIFATVESTSSSSSTAIDHLVVSLSGSVTSTGESGSAGGIASSVAGAVEVSTAANYMNGSISGGLLSGGMCGSLSGGATLSNSINAMKGSVEFAGVQDVTGGGAAETVIRTDLGLAHVSPGTTTASEPASLSGSFGPLATGTHAGVDALDLGPGLEFFPFEFEDSVGNSYRWEFLFANVPDPHYSHVAVSAKDVAGPVEVQTDLPVSSMVEFVYLISADANEVTAEPGVPIAFSTGVVTDTNGTTLFPVPPLLIATTSPFSVDLSWSAVEGAARYRVGFVSAAAAEASAAAASAAERFALTGGDETSLTVTNLDASTEYLFQLYYATSDDSPDDGSSSSFAPEADAHGSVTTPANSASGYVLSGFLVDGRYDFSGLSPDKTSLFAPIVGSGSLLGQDESVLLRVNGETRELLVSGPSGSTVDATDGDQYILPFQPSEGSGQSLALEGLVEGAMDYDESTNSVTVAGVELSPGGSVVVGGTRITLRDV